MAAKFLGNIDQNTERFINQPIDELLRYLFPTGEETRQQPVSIELPQEPVAVKQPAEIKPTDILPEVSPQRQAAQPRQAATASFTGLSLLVLTVVAAGFIIDQTTDKHN